MTASEITNGDLSASKKQSPSEAESETDPDMTSGQTSSSPNPTILSSLRSVLFVISSALIGFAAARNSLTW